MRKKKLALLFAMAWLLWLNALAGVTGSHLPINQNNITYYSVIIPFNVVSTTYSGNYKMKSICKEDTTTVWISGDTSTNSGTGVKLNQIRGLKSSTLYRFKTIVWKDTLPPDTIIGGTFTTAAAPAYPSITINEIPKIGSSQLVVTVTGANGYAPKLWGIYGNLYEYTTDTMSGTGNFKDTLYLETPEANTVQYYCIWFHPGIGVPLRDTLIKCDSFKTPEIIAGTISGLVMVSGIDTMKVSAVVSLGTFPGTVTFIAKDSLGVIRGSSAQISATISGIYSYVFRGLNQNTLYYVEAMLNDSVSTDTVVGSKRTLIRPLKPAPAARFITSPAPVTYCGHIDLGGYTIIPSSGDIGRAVIVRGLDSNLSNMIDTIQRFNTIMTNLSQGVFSTPAPQTGVRYHWRIITWSMDGVMAVSPAISCPSGPRISPNYLLDVVGLSTSQNPVLEISGDAFCESAVIYITAYNSSTGQTFYDTIDVGYDHFSINEPWPNLPPGDWTVYSSLRTASFTIESEMPKVTRNLATGIKQNISEQIYVFPIPTTGMVRIEGIHGGGSVTVTNITGQVIYKGIVSQMIDLTGNPVGMYNLQIENDAGIANKKIVIQ